MPEKRTIDRAREDAREGKAPGTQAGEFVREEMDHIREGKHGARNTKQAIAIGLSKARRAGVKLKSPAGRYSADVKKKAEQDSERESTARASPQQNGRARPCKRSSAKAIRLHREKRYPSRRGGRRSDGRRDLRT